MSTKLREAACLSALKDTKQKIMELETQVSADVFQFVFVRAIIIP